jgi:hypothetical protein
MEQQKCSATVYPNDKWGAFHPHQCEKGAVVQRNGKWYCKIHDPEYIEKKQVEKGKRWDKEHEQRMLERKAASACRAINPENPMAVAEGMKEVYEFLENMAEESVPGALSLLTQIMGK